MVLARWLTPMVDGPHRLIVTEADLVAERERANAADRALYVVVVVAGGNFGRSLKILVPPLLFTVKPRRGPD